MLKAAPPEPHDVPRRREMSKVASLLVFSKNPANVKCCAPQPHDVPKRRPPQPHDVPRTCEMSKVGFFWLKPWKRQSSRTHQNTGSSKGLPIPCPKFGESGGILGPLGLPACTRVKWVRFVLLAFFPCCFDVFFPWFTVVFASKLAIFPPKRSVLGAWKGHFRAWKGQMVDLGFQDPKTTWNALKTRENVTTPQLASLHGLPPNSPNKCYKTGEKNAKRTNGTHFARPHFPRSGGSPCKLWYFPGLSLKKSATFEISRVQCL